MNICPNYLLVGTLDTIVLLINVMYYLWKYSRLVCVSSDILSYLLSPSIIHPALGNSLLSWQDLSRARTENRTWSLWTAQINSWLEARYLWSKKLCVPGIRVSRHRGMIKRFIYRGCGSWALQGCCRLLQAPSWHQSLQISDGEHGRGPSTPGHSSIW